MGTAVAWGCNVWCAYIPALTFRKHKSYTCLKAALYFPSVSSPFFETNGEIIFICLLFFLRVFQNGVRLETKFRIEEKKESAGPIVWK